MKSIIVSLAILGTMGTAPAAFGFGFHPHLPPVHVPPVHVPPVHVPPVHVDLPRPRPPQLPDVRTWVSLSDNIGQRQQEIKNRYNSVIWGKHFDYAEYSKFASAIAASVASENPGPVQIYLQALLAEMKAQIIHNAKSEGRVIAEKLTMRFLMQAVNVAVNGGHMPRYDFGRIKIEPGKVMYDHWKDVTLGIPEFHGTTVVWTQKHNRTDLPKTFQLYIGVDY